jgi:hypothetical protein
VLLAWAAALLVLLNTVVAVLIVDFASLFFAENFVGFGYLDKLLARLLVTTGICQLGCVEVLRVFGWTYGFLSGWYFLLSVRYAFLISRSEASFLMPSSCAYKVSKRSWNLDYDVEIEE